MMGLGRLMCGAQVPCVQDARYSRCCDVSSSIWMPIEASLRRAISRAISRGTTYTRRSTAAPPPLERGPVPDHVLGGQGLVREAHVHDRGGMALGGSQVDEPPLAEHV